MSIYKHNGQTVGGLQVSNVIKFFIKLTVHLLSRLDFDAHNNQATTMIELHDFEVLSFFLFLSTNTFWMNSIMFIERFLSPSNVLSLPQEARKLK
jgi:hypothetical protein